MAWMREWRWSKSYLAVKKIEGQLCFEWCKLKQRSTMLGNDEHLKLFGSAKFRILQTSTCHCWILEKQSLKMEFQLGFNGSKDSQMLSRWRNNEGCSRVFGVFAQKSQIVKNARRWEWAFSVLWRLPLGLVCAENFIYMCCFKSPNQMLNLFYLNEAICKNC
jgi:hypothetical protein